jgi:hypothetical protein
MRGTATPDTDDAETQPHETCSMVVPSDFARRLETERDELRAEVERLKAENTTFRNAQRCCQKPQEDGK